MQYQSIIQLLLLLQILISYNKSQVISQSQIEQCYQGDKLNCSQKLLVSLSIENGQLNSVQQIKISQTQNGSILEQPITVTVQKTQVYALYKIVYLQDFNAQPVEIVISSSILDCDEDYYSSQTTCGFQYDADGNKIYDSQGFCCVCSFSEIIGLDDSKLDRGNICSALNLGQGSATAHCLRYSPVWYSAFKIMSYQIYFEIQISIQFNSTYNQTIIVGSSQFVSQSDQKTIIARLIGNFAPLEPPPELNSYYLMKPSKPQQSALALQGSRSWMFIPMSDVTLDGTQCNKVGVGYTAFQNQANPCRQNVGSCLHNQLQNFYQSDLKRIANDEFSQYLIGSWGSFQQVQYQDEAHLSLEINGTFPSLITLEINADQIRFISNLGNAVIDFANISNFQSQSGNGKLIIQVTNIGQIASQFSIAINCSELVTPITAQNLFISAQQSIQIIKEVSVTSIDETNDQCKVILLNSIGDLLDQIVIDFNTSATIIKNSQTNSSSSTTQNQSIQPQPNQANCDNICKSFWDIPCFFMNECSQQIYRAFSVLLSIIFLITVIGCLIRNRHIFCIKCFRKKKNKYIDKQNSSIQFKQNRQDQIEQISIIQTRNKIIVYCNFHKGQLEQIDFSFSVKLVGIQEDDSIQQLQLIQGSKLKELFQTIYGIQYRKKLKQLLKNIIDLSSENKKFLTLKPTYRLI